MANRYDDQNETENWDRERRLEIAEEQEPRRFRRRDLSTAAELARLRSMTIGFKPIGGDE